MSSNNASEQSNAKMTSLAVFPSLKKTITDLMDEELYQAPQSPSTFAQFASDFGRTGSITSSPTMNSNAATATLSNLLNIPDSFMEHYNRVNGSSNTVNNIPSLLLDSSNDYNSYETDAAAVNPFNTYANPDLFQQQQQQYQLAYVKPELVQIPRRSRITTLERPSAKQSKDDDYYLFNTDIQPSQMMSFSNFINSEDMYADSSLFIMNGDLDKVAKGNSPVPGFENDYLALDEFAEDAEDLSEDSDDDNYFQDDNDEFDDLIMNANAFSAPATDNFMPVRVLPGSEEGFMDVRKVVSMDSMDLQSEVHPEVAGADDDMMIDDDEMEHSAQNSAVSSLLREGMNAPEEYHMTAAEITATNPDHHCELVNPSTGHPCNKQFSRPYDLIRHQETIHASKKKIFRCVICEGRLNGGPGNGKLKTFSRGDALSRHIKVKHGLGGQEAVDLINEAKENVEYQSV